MENYTNQRYCQESSYNILIEIDYREHKTIKDFEEYFKNVEVKTLDTADYIISDKYTKKKLCYIERKTLADFISTEVDTSRYKTYEKMYRKNREINTKIYCIIVLQKKTKVRMNLDINKAINNMSIRFNIICMTCLEENFIKVVDQIALSNDMYNKFMSLKTYVDQNNIRPVIKNNWAIISKTIRANILYYINLSHEDNLFAILQKKQKLSDLINNKYLLLCFIDVLLNLDAEEYSGLYKIYNEDCNYDFVGGKPTKTIYNYTYNVWTGLPGLSYKSTDKLIDKYSVYDIVVNKQYPDIRLTKTGKNSIVALMDGSKFHERVVLSKCPNISHYTASQILYEYSLSDILSNISILYNYKVVKKRTITISKDIADNAYKILCYKK